MKKQTAAILGAAAVLVAGGFTARAVFQPTDAERMPEVAQADFDAIDALITELYASISGPIGQERDPARMQACFAENATLTSMQPMTAEYTTFRAGSMTPDEYIERSFQFLQERGFTESEIGRTLEVYGTIAHAFSAYEGDYTRPDGEKQMVKGINSIQLIKNEGEWKVFSILWDQQWPEGRNPVPERYIAADEG